MTNPEILKYIPLYHGRSFLFQFKDSYRMVSGKINMFSLDQTSCTLHGDFLHNWYKEETWGDIDTLDGTLKLILKDPAELSDLIRGEYFRLTKTIPIHSERKFIRADTPDSILFMLRNGIDAFDLIKRQMAMTRKEFLHLWGESTLMLLDSQEC